MRNIGTEMLELHVMLPKRSLVCDFAFKVDFVHEMSSVFAIMAMINDYQ